MAVKKGGLNMGKGLQSLIPSGNSNIKPESEKKAAEKNAAVKKTAAKADEKPAEAKKTAVKASEKPESAKKAVEKPELDENSVVEVKISLVIPNSEQPRKEFDDAALSELSESVKNFGIIQPLLVQKKGKYYEIIAGERRWRAAKLAGLKKVPVIVRDYTTQQVMEISLIENIQREDLNAIEEAEAYKKLIEEFDLTQADLSKRVSKSRTAIANSLRLLNLDDRVKNMLKDGILSPGHARAILSLEDGDLQFDAATIVVAKSLNVRETEKLIQRMKKPVIPVEKEEDEQIDDIYNSIEEQLKSIMGTKVSIKRKKAGKGMIEIEYYSAQEFDRILDLLHKAKEDTV